ncbi:MAG: class I SAM-dependent methyltransferase [Candidatus Aminicenantes bacterium]|nr:MAG: class I SAM-dependent methyltransferase [Candidatus Aminicenantes bacterium]
MRKKIAEHYDCHCCEYEEWIKSHPHIHQSEEIIFQKVAPSGVGLEIGVGTGRLATALSIRFGLDPSLNMLKLAQQKNVLAVQGFGENLPFKKESFNFVLIVYTIELADDALRFLKEAAKSLKKRGVLILGIANRESAWGKFYEQEASRGFWHWYSIEEILHYFKRIGLEFQEAFHTHFHAPPDIKEIEVPKKGFGQGGLVVFKAVKQ